MLIKYLSGLYLVSSGIYLYLIVKYLTCRRISLKMIASVYSVVFFSSFNLHEWKILHFRNSARRTTICRAKHICTGRFWSFRYNIFLFFFLHSLTFHETPCRYISSPFLFDSLCENIENISLPEELLLHFLHCLKILVRAKNKLTVFSAVV